MRVCRYLRVSRGDQNPQLQADETQRLIESRGWDLVDTFIDHGVSGGRERRPDLDRMMTGARKGQFQAIIVWRSDRLFRSLRNMINAIEELSSMNIDFVSVTELFDSTTAQGRLLFHLVSAFGEFERELLRARTVAALDSCRRRGIC